LESLAADMDQRVRSRMSRRIKEFRSFMEGPKSILRARQRELPRSRPPWWCHRSSDSDPLQTLDVCNFDDRGAVGIPALVAHSSSPALRRPSR
jgi:hypothetical protein